MATVVLFNKPFQVMPQFTDASGRATLSDYIVRKGVYPAGRLDYDSEGLMLLTDDGHLQQRIADPAFKLEKTYWVQVEGVITEAALNQLATGLELKDGVTRPAKAVVITAPDLWPRNPPVRFRKNQPTSWLELKISEGRNRQVRRMTAAVGFPTLRLVRVAIGPWRLDGLMPGESRDAQVHLPEAPRKQQRVSRSHAGKRRQPRPSNGDRSHSRGRAGKG